MQLQSIKVSESYESDTNPRGKDFEGKEFDELVVSIMEKGVLVPVLARVKPKGAKKFEVVAGNRRLRAAQRAGLTELPAQIVEMTDVEAREAQIVENLQRADVHPLEEGEAYRQLLEASGGKLTPVDVAIRVGKTESYVKQRLFLTNLEPKPKSAYRSGKIADGHAVLIAKLSAGDQLAVLKAATDRYETMSVKQLKEWIDSNIYSPLETQPWVAKKEYQDVVGKCVECKPERASLFGNVKEGACTDMKCWTRKMTAFLNYRVKTEKLLKVSTEYGGAPNGVLGKDEYVVVAKRGKGRCESARTAIVVQGAHFGETFDVCADKECQTHHGERSEYRLTPEEKERRKKERERAVVKEQKFNDTISAALERIKWPLDSKMLDTLLDVALEDTGTSFLMPIVKRHALKADKTNDGRDYKAPLRRLAQEGGDDGKLRMIFELHLPTYNSFVELRDLNKRLPKL